MLADLDELILKCRDERAKKYIDEAVKCYRTGAYRAAVVATWIAVCFDVVDKLRELDGSGDAKANAKVQEIDRIRAANDIAASLRFENEIPALTLEFEFVNHTECIDLERLQKDRNRCAHPTNNSQDDVFEVPSELARLHIRNAVIHLLQHEPAQGKAALDRLWDSVISNTFPTVKDRILANLQAGPLRRARDSLYRNFLVLVLKNLFQGDQKLRSKLALIVMQLRVLRGELWETVVRERIPLLVRSAIADKDMMQTIYALRRGEADLWDYVPEVERERLTNFVRQIPSSEYTMLDLVELSPFEDAVAFRHSRATLEEIENSYFFDFPKPLVDRVIQFLKSSTTFARSNQIFKFLLNNLGNFDQVAIEDIVRTAKANDQVSGANGFENLLARIRRDNVHGGAAFIDPLLRTYGFEV